MTKRRSHHFPGKYVRGVLFCVFPASLCSVAHAQTIDYQIGLSLLHSDNIGLSQDHPVSDNVLSPSLDFDIEQRGSSIELKAHGNFQYLDYLDNTFSNGSRGALSGQLNWSVYPERVNFVVEDYLSRQPVDVLTAFTPANEQQVNVFVAGPSLTANFGGATRGQLDLRYTNTYAQDNNAFNGDRYNVAGRLLRRLRSTNWLGINVETTRVNFNNTGTSLDYTRSDGYLSYVSNLSFIDVDLAAGYSQVKLNDSGRTVSGPLLRATLDWRASPRSTLIARANYEFGDATTNLIANAGNPDIPVVGDASTLTVRIRPNAFRQRRHELGYRFDDVRLSAELNAYDQHVAYLDNVTPDEDSRGGYAQLEYRLRPETKLSLVAARSRRTFDALSRADTDSIVDLALTQQFTQHWSGRIDLQARKRSSTVIGQGYQENAVIVSVHYRR